MFLSQNVKADAETILNSDRKVVFIFQTQLM